MGKMGGLGDQKPDLDDFVSYYFLYRFDNLLIFAFLTGRR